MGQALSIGAAIIDPISYGVGYAAEAVNPSGWFSALADVGTNMFGKIGNAESAGEDVTDALITGAGTDIRRGINVFSGPVGWGAEGIATTSDFLGHSNVGLIDSTTSSYISLGASAGAGAWNIGSSLLSSGASVAAESATSSAAKVGTDVASTATASTSSMLSDSAYLASYYGTDVPIYGTSGLTYAEAAERGTAAAYGLSSGSVAGTGVQPSVLYAGTGAGSNSTSAFASIGADVTKALKVGSAGLQLYGAYTAANAAQESASAEAYEANMKAEQEDTQSEISLMQAEANELKQIAETNAAAEEKAQLAKRRRAIVGKGKTAAAANGVMLEIRAESAPAMFEQDAAAEMAYEQGKVDYNMRIKNANHAMNAAINRASASVHGMSAINWRNRANYAKRLGNLNSTSAWIQGAAGAATSLASAFQ